MRTVLTPVGEGRATRAIDLWINANLITLLATGVTAAFAWEWHRDNQHVRKLLTGRLAAMARLNATVARWVMGLSGAVFGLGLYMIQVARDIDQRSSAKSPARIPEYVVQGTVAFTCIWVAACVGAWWFRRTMGRIIAMEE